jgi:hypothetical protein
MEFGRTYSFSIVAEAIHQVVPLPPVSDGCGRIQISGVTPLPATPVIRGVTAEAMDITFASGKVEKTGRYRVSIQWDCVNQSESG